MSSSPGSLPERGPISSVSSLEDATGFTKAAVMQATLWSKEKGLQLWGMTTRRMRVVGGIVLFMSVDH